MRERIDIADAKAAALLSRLPMQRVLATLIASECTMSELTGLTGISYSLLSHHLKRMLDMGLVVVAGQSPRAGRPSLRYRAAARSYFIPAHWCQTLPGERMARDLRAALERTSAPKGLLLFDDGGPRIQLVAQEARPDVTELWLRLRLSAADARQFNDEMRALFARWRAHESKGGRRYIVHGACAREE